jgi:preprotein translocase subunit YajC
MAHWSTTKRREVFDVRERSEPHKPTRETVAVMDLVVFLPLLIILGAFMFFASRRQKKAMQATINLHESLKIGDRIHTTSGLQGTITAIADDTISLEIAPGVVTTWMKLAVRDRIEPAEETTALDGGYDVAPGAAEVIDTPPPSESITDTDRYKRD